MLTIFNSITFESPDSKDAIDKTGDKIQLLKEENVPWENWDGKLPPGKITPLAWKTIIDNESMVMGITPSCKPIKTVQLSLNLCVWIKVMMMQVFT